MINAESIQVPALVYVRTPAGPRPQIWRERQGDLDRYWKGRIVAWRPIVAHDIPSIDYCVDFFPPPASPPTGPKFKL